jgi:F-type H+-transporting ATPase subunit delta
MSRNSEIAKLYARAYVEVSESQLVNFFSEFSLLNDLLNVSSDLENVLFMHVFTSEEKLGIVNDLLAKLNVSATTKKFIDFLIKENRITLFPQIFKEIVVYDDHRKGFIKVDVQGSDNQLSAEVEKDIVKFLTEKLHQQPQIKYTQHQEILAGYHIAAGDISLNATVEFQLEEFKKTFFSIH